MEEPAATAQHRRMHHDDHHSARTRQANQNIDALAVRQGSNAAQKTRADPPQPPPPHAPDASGTAAPIDLLWRASGERRFGGGDMRLPAGSSSAAAAVSERLRCIPPTGGDDSGVLIAAAVAGTGVTEPSAPAPFLRLQQRKQQGYRRARRG